MLIDISWPIEPGALLHPEDPKPRFNTYSSISAGADYNLTELSLSLHTGTHLDAPRHFSEAGPAIDALPLEQFDCPCHVVDTGDAEAVVVEHLAGLDVQRGDAVVFRTRNGRLPRDRMAESWVYITPEAAQRCVELGCALVGMDYIEVESGVDEGMYPVHTTLLTAGVLLLENLDLRQVPAGKYRLLCFPIKISGAEGAPCRAVLETLPAR